MLTYGVVFYLPVQMCVRVCVCMFWCLCVPVCIGEREGEWGLSELVSAQLCLALLQ